MTKFSELPSETPSLADGFIHWWNPNYVPANRNKKTSLIDLLQAWADSIGLTNFVRQNEPHSFSANQGTTIVELEENPTILVNGSAGNYFRLTLTQNGNTLTAPSPLFPGPYIFTIIQDSVGGNSLIFAPDYKFPSESDKNLSLSPNAQDVLSCVYDGLTLKCVLAKDFEL